MASTPKFTVGQTVIIRSSNDRGDGEPRRGTVEKVGRTLVYVKAGEWTTVAYRIKDGWRNDDYGHTRIQTEAEFADEKVRADLTARMQAHRVTVEHRYGSNLPTDVLAQIVAILEAPRA